MDQLLALLDTYRWLGSAFGVLVLTGVFRYLATRMLNQAALRAERTETLGTMPFLKRLRSPWVLGFG